MIGVAAARIFISYSRNDGGAEFAADLRHELISEGFSVWQDIVSLEGGRDWWSQIEDAIKSPSLDHLVLVLTESALENSVIRREIRLARQEGKTVLPIKGPGMDRLDRLPRWIGQIYDLDLTDHKQKFLLVLASPSQQSRVPLMAPEPPKDFVERLKEIATLKKKLLDRNGDSLTISVALKGAGGFGKTTLAMAIAHDADIQDAYFDGILWVELGQNPTDILEKLSDLILRLTGAPPGLATVRAASSALRDALGNRRILFIIDDVWRHQDLLPFLEGGPKTSRIITTRLNSVLPTETFRLPVNGMEKKEANVLLCQGMSRSTVRGFEKDLNKLARRVGDWPQLLKLVNGFLRERVVDSNGSLSEAISDANARLDSGGLIAFDAENEEDRTKVVSITMNLSLSLLSIVQRDRFSELAVFPEDANIPIDVVARLWRESGQFNLQDTKDLLVKLFGLSLILDLDLTTRSVRLHDTIRHHLENQLSEKERSDEHERLLGAMKVVRDSRGVENSTYVYYYTFLLHHLVAANRTSEVEALLLDPGWLVEKLKWTKRPHSLVTDYDQYAADKPQMLIGRAIRLIVGICSRDPRQLLPQLAGRLIENSHPEIEKFTLRALKALSRPAIIADLPSLTPAGSENMRIETSSQWIAALTLLEDGRLVSGSGDGIVRLWELDEGLESCRLIGHEAPLTSMCVTSDGNIATGSLDATVRVWDVDRELKPVILRGHSGPVSAVCSLSDGSLVSGSTDGSVVVWDVSTESIDRVLVHDRSQVLAVCRTEDGLVAVSFLDGSLMLLDAATGSEVVQFTGHNGPINTICNLPDGRIASGSDDNSIRIWDCSNGQEKKRLDGHLYPVTTLDMLPDGRLASGSWDDMINLWRIDTGELITRIEGHSGTVSALCHTDKDTLVSGSWDETIRVWETVNPYQRRKVERHSDNVSSLCMLSNGTLASGSGDATVRFWDVSEAKEIGRLETQSGWVTAICPLLNGHFASAAWDQNVRVWDVNNLSEVLCFFEPAGRVNSLCAWYEDIVATGVRDNTIGIWDITTGSLVRRLAGHTGPINSVCALDDGRLASGSDDGTICIWNRDSEECDMQFAGHEARITAICMMVDNVLVSASWDETIRIWDMSTCEPRGIIQTNVSQISSIAIIEDLVAFGALDNTVRVWDLNTETQIACLELDSPVQSLAVPSAKGIIAGDDLGWLHWLKLLR